MLELPKIKQNKGYNYEYCSKCGLYIDDLYLKDLSFRAIAYGKDGKIIHDFTYGLFREPEEPMLTVFFSSVEEGVKFGIAKDKIQTT